MKPTEYSESIRNQARTKKAVCVLISVRRRDKQEKEDLPLLLYAYTNDRADVPYCDATRILGAYRLRKQRTVKQRAKDPTATMTPSSSALRVVCVGPAPSKDTAALLAKLEHRPQKRIRSSFSPHVADIKHNDAQLDPKRKELVKNGTIQKVDVTLDKSLRRKKEHEDARICTVCSFYLAHDRPPVEDVGTRATGCYYLYKKANCPHSLAASSDPTKFNRASTVSMNELGKYVVATTAGEVDLAKWIYAKFHGTAYTTDGVCLTDKADKAERAERAERADELTAREAAVMRNAPSVLLATRDAPRHVPLSSLRLVTEGP
jgi:hypothetical protein